jgi:Putative prokaryotic signal transducing protein
VVRFRVVSQEFEARMISDLLKQNGIDSRVSGSREYSSVILGGGGIGRYEILVSKSDLHQAGEILAEVEKSNRDESKSPDEEIKPTNTLSQSFKKSFFFAIAGAVILPFVFNYFSIVHAMNYYKLRPTAKSPLLHILGFVLLLVLNALMIIIYPAILRQISS